MEASYEAIDSMAEYHIKNGVTGFMPTTMTNPTEDIVKAIKNTADYMKNQNKGSKAKVLGLYTEGPFFRRRKKVHNLLNI